MFPINLENLKTLKFHLFLKILSLSIVCSKCGNEYKKYLKKKNQLKYLKFLLKLIILKSIRKYITMPEENISQESRLKNIDETKNYFIEEINQNELISKKY